jgi:hypothetical protein
MADLNNTLKDQLHLTHHLGTAKRTTIYAKAMLDAQPGTDGKASNAFKTTLSSQLKGAETNTTHKFRTGSTATPSNLHKWGRRPTNKCPCGQIGTGMHMASGCKYLKKAYIDRHHKAGQILLKSIARGELGDRIIYADIGKASSLTAAGVPTSTRIKLQTKSLKLPRDSEMTNSRPDIILGTHNTTSTGVKYSKLVLLELKYARDTNIQSQLDKARTQHTQLATTLERQHKCPVKVIPIILGVSGTIYTNHTVAALEEIGLKKQALKSTLQALHLHAIRSLHQLYIMYKRHLRSHTGPTIAAAGGLDPGD